MKSINIFLFVAFKIIRSDGARIVATFAIPSPSHIIVVRPLLEALAQKGHHVTLISGFPRKELLENYEDVSVPEIISGPKKYFFRINHESVSFFDRLKLIQEYAHYLGNIVFEHENYGAFLNRTEKADLFIVYGLFHDVFLGLANRLNASVVLFNPAGSDVFNSYFNGDPTPYSYVPFTFSDYTDDMNFWQRIGNTLASLKGYLSYAYTVDSMMQSLLDKYFPDAPKLHELRNNVELSLINSHYSVEFLRPSLPGNIKIGGFHMHAPLEALPDVIQKLMDQAANGVIYFSLGTNMAEEFLKHSLKAICKVFGSLDYLILWKTDIKIRNFPKNVFTYKWFPQRSVLAHPNIKLFISHGGMISFIESTFYGVPILGIPFFLDQNKNILTAVTNGYALKLASNEISETTFGNAINQLLKDESFTRNAKFRSSLLRTQEVNPMDKAIYWIEHTLMHSGHLRSKAATSLPLYKYLLLDVVGFLLLTGLVLSFLVYELIKYSFRYLKEIFKKSEKDIKIKLK